MYLVFLAVSLLVSPASARDAVSMSAVTLVTLGEKNPTVTFHTGEPGRVRANLACAGRSFEVDRSVPAETDVVMDLAGLPAGEHPCTGELQMTLASGEEIGMPLALTVALLGLIGFEYSYDDMDLEAHALMVRPSRALKAASMDIYSDGGAVVETVHADLSDPSAARFSWATNQEVVKVDIVGEDKYGFRSSLQLTPWHYAIPHDDVVFASGSAAITADEVPKLESTWDDAVAVMNKYGGIVEIQLFVAGYTDSVGAPGANQGLSERRAKAIAVWFRKRGFSGNISYQGFGETAQAVETGDEVDEIRNRRALYVLAASVPPASHHLPLANWKSL